MFKGINSKVTFREDINGLRAWSVVAVLLFHFGLIGLPGGFSGVDVFFVISGYLMTAIIVSGMEENNFRLFRFYMSRVRRIFPAFLALIFSLLVLGWFLLPSIEYQELGEQSSYGMLFLSNLLFWRSSGYFDSASEEKWLLHTWSLAVEAQFYIIYPIIISLIWKINGKLKFLFVCLSLLFSYSLALNILTVSWKPSAAFYLLPTRMWELIAGGLVFLCLRCCTFSSLRKDNAFYIGFFLIISSFIFSSESLSWPSYWAAFPVMGASLIILGNKGDSILINNALLSWLGKRSYSLYLWHWPFVVALNFSELDLSWE